MKFLFIYESSSSTIFYFICEAKFCMNGSIQHNMVLLMIKDPQLSFVGPYSLYLHQEQQKLEHQICLGWELPYFDQSSKNHHLQEFWQRFHVVLEWQRHSSSSLLLQPEYIYIYIYIYGRRMNWKTKFGEIFIYLIDR